MTSAPAIHPLRLAGAVALVALLCLAPRPTPAADQAPTTPATDSLAGIVIGRDWPNWRGPFCNGSAGDCGVEMVKTIDQARVAWTSELAFRPAWQSDPATYPNWGYSDFAVVDGRLYYRYTEAAGPVSESEKQEALAWLMKKHGPEAPSHKHWKPEVIERIATILGRVRADEGIICIDIENGRTLWRTVFPLMGLSQVHTLYKNYGTQGTPAVAYGRVYTYGAGFGLYAVDQVSGEPLWRTDAGELAVQGRTHYRVVNERGRFLPGLRARDKNYSDGFNSADGCPMPVGGAIAVSGLDGRSQGDDSSMAGFDAATGRPLWKIPDCCGGTFNATPLRWRHDGREYVVAGYSKRTVCVEPLTGRLCWEFPGFANGKAMGAISGDHLVNVGDAWGDAKAHPPHCLKLGPDQAELVWKHASTKKGMRIFRFTAPLVYRDLVYIQGAGCLDLKTGEQVGSNKAAGGYNPIAADGLVYGDKAGLGPAGADVTEAWSWPRDWPQAEGETVQVMVGGRLYLRCSDKVACIDLRAEPPAVGAAEDPVVAQDIPGLIGQLSHRYLVVRERAVEALVGQGAAAAEALAEAMRHESWLVRQAAAQALLRLGKDAAAVAPTLAGLLPQAVAEGHWGQAMVLVDAIRGADPAAFAGCIDALAALTTGDDDLVLRRACWTLGAIGEAAAPAAGALATLVARDDPYLSAAAAEALGDIGPGAKAAVPALLTAIGSGYGPVVAWSLDALRRIGPPAEAMQQLIERMWSPQVGTFDGACRVRFTEHFNMPLIAWQAGECLKRLGPSVVGPVVASLKGRRGDKFDPTMAVNVLAHFPAEAKPHLKAIEAFAGDKSFDRHYLKRIEAGGSEEP